MTSNEFARRMARARSTAGSLVAVATSLLLAGCSADIANFDFPAFNLNDQQASSSTGSIPRPPEPMLGSRAGLIGQNASDHSSGAVSQTELAPLNAAPQPPQRYAALTDNSGPGPGPVVAPITSAQQLEPRRPAAAPVAPPVQTAAAASPSSGSSTIIVKPGDTLYSLSKRHGVGLDKLMTANGLKSNNLKPGQQLVLPGGSTSVATAPPPASTPAQTVATDPGLAASWHGSYTMKQGDVLYTIARQHNVKVAELQAANGISDPRKVRPGTVLKVPGSGTGPAPVASAPEPPKVSAPAPLAQATGPSEPRRLAMAPTILNSPAPPPAAQAPTATDAQPAAPSIVVQPPTQTGDLSKLRWPVQGKVIASFGQRADGTHNDGVNLSVPMGTTVHAAEEGTVAYAGNELKGYGNLVLIRHDNGWVTAYAHAEDVLVKRGDRVKRGDVIAKAGKTGQVDQPQLHFELRQNSKPVDPTPYMESL